MMAIEATTTSIRIPSDLLDRFDRLASSTERTRSYHVLKALAAYIAEQEYLNALFTDLKSEADNDPTAMPNVDAIASAVTSGLMRAEDLESLDPISDAEYIAAQSSSAGWR
jgi:RHH-type transcriptional regulator, rel operon repressor / antitoxin RelB